VVGWCGGNPRGKFVVKARLDTLVRQFVAAETTAWHGRGVDSQPCRWTRNTRIRHGRGSILSLDASRGMASKRASRDSLSFERSFRDAGRSGWRCLRGLCDVCSKTVRCNHSLCSGNSPASTNPTNFVARIRLHGRENRSWLLFSSVRPLLLLCADVQGDARLVHVQPVARIG